MRTKILLPRRHDFLLLFFLLFSAAAGEMSCFAWAVGPAAALKLDRSTLPSERGTYSGTQSQICEDWCTRVDAHMCPYLFGAGAK